MSAVDPYIIETWIKGWTLAREVPPPVKDGDGFRVDVGWPQQQVRYVFPTISTTFQRLAKTIREPWHFLKVCAPPEAIRSFLPPQWVIQPIGYMMLLSGSMVVRKACLPEGYRISLDTNAAVPVAKIYAAEGVVAAIGRVVLVDDFAIYDHIETHPDHRRRGLGSALMKALETFSTEHGKTKGVLVATAQGKALYETLGWQLYTLYTTAVIPGLDVKQNTN